MLNVTKAVTFDFDKTNHELSTTQIKKFYDDGFLVINNVFEQNEMLEAIKATDDELSKIHDTNPLNWPLHKLNATKNNIIRKLCEDKRLIPILNSLLGEDIQLQHSKFAVKYPGKNRGLVNWHQDFAFFPHTNDSLIAIAIALTDVTIENGAMIMVQGSHKHGLLNHYKDNGEFAEQYIGDDSIFNTNNYVALCPKIGGISIHHCLSAHSSYDNTTDNSRYMVVFEYRAADAYQLADGVWDDTGLQISGKYLNKVRFDARFLKKDKDGSVVLPLPKGERYGAEFPFGHAYNQIGDSAKIENSVK